MKKAIAAAKAKGFDPKVELPPQQYAAHMRRWSQGTLGGPGHLGLCNNDWSSGGSMATSRSWPGIQPMWKQLMAATTRS